MSEPHKLGNGPVSVTIGTTKWVATASDGRHEMVIDEPEYLGGKDTAPGPYEYMLAGLGACKAITASMYAARKGWAVEEIRLTMDHSRPEGRGGPELISGTIEFVGDLDEKQIARLKHIAEQCPLQKTITGELSVVTELATANRR